jgi:hypothetical protein
MMLLLAVQSLYVGNNACAPCHAEIYRQFSATPMAQSSGRVAGNVPAGSFRQASSGAEYRINESGKVEIAKGSHRAERQLEYFIGSGAAGRSYLYSQDGFLFQAPVTWYARQSRWDASPGYDKDRVSRWNRAIEPDCLNCHSSQVRSSETALNRYATPPFAQSGIGCERCHGPGSEHISGRAKMVDPRQLQAKERDSVCAQCHMSGEARVARAGKQLSDYRPRARLSDYVAYFVYDKPAPMRATSYVEKLSASRCKIASGDALWCGTCHDPHRVPAPAESVAWFRAKCLTCHKPDDCSHSQGDCAGCHMPKASVIDGGNMEGGHGVLTDHSIPRTVRETQPVPASDWRLHGFSSLDTGDRELGLAYAEVAARTGNQNQAAEAIRLLASAPVDADVALRLASLYQRQGADRLAITLYEKALALRPGSMAALVNLGLYDAAAGKLDAAIALWKQALNLNPCAAEARQNLKIAFTAKGDVSALKQLSQRQANCTIE